MSIHQSSADSSSGAAGVSGVKLPTVSVDVEENASSAPPPVSKFSLAEALSLAELQHLSQGEGEILYHPQIRIDIGDVLYLRQRTAAIDQDESQESGVIVQVIAKGTASYQAAEQKSLFRLMTAVRAIELTRSFHESPEVIDEFMIARVRVRASIIDGIWVNTTSNSVTRNVDIFIVNPQILLDQITRRFPSLDLTLGDYKGQPISFAGSGFEKVNLITGMKGAGKSHITKGIIDESRQAGVSAIVFDINNEYDALPKSKMLEPGRNLKFRLDRLHPEAFLKLIMRLAPPGDQTKSTVSAKIPRILEDAIRNHRVPDIQFLRGQLSNIVPGKGPVAENMRASFGRSLDIVDSLNLIMTEQEAKDETAFIKAANVHIGDGPSSSESGGLEVQSLSAALAGTIEQGPCVLTVRLGGLASEVQKVVVMMIIDHIKDLCQRQTRATMGDSFNVPIYPSIYFEEAHMYMEDQDIDDLIPIIRHIGPNLFFITNTPGALPESVIRLVDNLVLTRLINHKDVSTVQNCGLTDADTISGFASNLPEHHALLLSGLEGCTRGFPLVFSVRDFGLPPSGTTRSMWKALEELHAKEGNEETLSDSRQSTA